ncbi:MAG: ABC transporter substrate-binding protein [Dehalococcoidia bacterium]
MAAGLSSGMFGTRMRRRRLMGTALAGGGAAFVIACGGSQSRSESTGGATGSSQGGGIATAVTGQTAPGSTEQVKRGGTFTISNGSPRTLDPHFDTFPANTIVTNNVYNKILTFTPDLTKIEPELATAMPEQPDPLTYTFKIRQGIKYQNVPPANGREMTAADVKYSIERQMTREPGKFQHAYFFLDRIASIETPDNYTVTMKMAKPYAPFMSYVASPWTMVINKELVERDGDLTQNAVGTGPFIFEEWQKDVQHRLRRNPDYWEKDASGGALPYVDNIVVRISTDANAIQAMFVNQDVLASGIQFTFVEEIKKKFPKANYRAVPSQFWRQMRTSPYDGMKYQHRAPFTDIRVRQAIVQSVNKQEILDTVFSGDGIPAFGPILPIYPLWALKEDPVKFDIASSKQLLEAAGHGQGWDDEMIFAQGAAGDTASQVGEVLKSQLAKIGVNVTLKPMDSTAYYNKTYAYDYTMSHHVPLNNPDPDENLASYFGRNSTFFKWGNQDVWALIDKQAETLDQAERQKIVEEAQRKIVLDYPMSFIYSPNGHYFTHSKVKGWFYPNDLYDGRLKEVWIDPAG